MNRDELIIVVSQALIDEGASPGSSLHSWRCEHPDRYGPCTCVADTAAEVLDVVEPLIRADEREAFGITLSGVEERAYAQGGHNRLADLRAKVEALPIAHHYGGERGWCVRIADVLALFDGGSDE